MRAKFYLLKSTSAHQLTPIMIGDCVQTSDISKELVLSECHGSVNQANITLNRVLIGPITAKRNQSSTGRLAKGN